MKNVLLSSFQPQEAAALACVLDEFGAQYQVLSEKEADIYAQVNASELILALSKKGCNVQSMQERDESLESYYISLVGVLLLTSSHRQ